MVLVQFGTDYHGFYRLGCASETLRDGWRPPRSLFYSTPLLPTSLFCDFCVSCAAVSSLFFAMGRTSAFPASAVYLIKLKTARRC